MIIGIVKCLYNSCINILSKAEEEHKKDKKEKEVNAVWKSTSHLFKEIGDMLAEAEKREIFDGHGEEPGKRESKKEEPVRAPCPHCGRKGQTKRQCVMERVAPFLCCKPLRLGPIVGSKTNRR